MPLAGTGPEPVRYEHGSELYRLALDLRREILRRPLGLDFTPEDIAAEASEIFFGLFIEGRAIGSVSLVDKRNHVKLRQMAIDPEFHGQGLGTILFEAAASWAKQQGFHRIELHARVTAAPFYEKQGCQRVGEVFTEVTLPHILMVKDL